MLYQVASMSCGAVAKIKPGLHICKACASPLLVTPGDGAQWLSLTLHLGIVSGSAWEGNIRVAKDQTWVSSMQDK